MKFDELVNGINAIELPVVPDVLTEVGAPVPVIVPDSLVNGLEEIIRPMSSEDFRKFIVCLVPLCDKPKLAAFNMALMRSDLFKQRMVQL